AADARRAPNFGFHSRHQAVLARGDLDFRVSRRPIAGDHQFQVPFQHQFHRPAGLLGENRSDAAPLVEAELGTESAAHVLAFDVNFVLGNFGYFAQAISITGDVLGGGPHIEFAVFDL